LLEETIASLFLKSGFKVKKPIISTSILWVILEILIIIGTLI